MNMGTEKDEALGIVEKYLEKKLDCGVNLHNEASIAHSYSYSTDEVAELVALGMEKGREQIREKLKRVGIEVGEIIFD